MPHSNYVRNRSQGPIQRFQKTAKTYAASALRAYAYSTLPYPANNLVAQQAHWIVDKVLSLKGRQSKTFGATNSNYWRGMSSFQPWRRNYRMPYRRRYRRNSRRRPSRRYRRRGRFNKTRHRMYKMRNWRKGAFQGVGPQCMPTHAFCKMKRKFAGDQTFQITDTLNNGVLFMIKHDLLSDQVGLQDVSNSLDFFNAVNRTTPHALAYLKDSFNVVRCFKYDINLKFCVVPSSTDHGHEFLSIALLTEDLDSASTDKYTTSTGLHDAMLDKRAKIINLLPWYNLTTTALNDTGFAPPRYRRLRKTVYVPRIIENTNVKHYFNDDDYANLITGALGSRVFQSPVASGDVTSSLRIWHTRDKAFAGTTPKVRIQFMGTITQYTIWSKQNANLKVAD